MKNNHHKSFGGFGILTFIKEESLGGFDLHLYRFDFSSKL